MLNINRNEALAGTPRRSEFPRGAREGVRRAAVFGSVARGDNRPDSDIDIMIEVDPDDQVELMIVGLKESSKGLWRKPGRCGRRRAGCCSRRAAADAVYAFSTS